MLKQSELAIHEFNMEFTEEQLKMLDEILTAYSDGDPHTVEGLKLTYTILVSRTFCNLNLIILGISSDQLIITF